MSALIEVKGLYKIYNQGLENEVRAVNNASLSIEKGEFLAILGSSGSGKSTLMNILGFLDVPTYGEYFLNGHPVKAFDDDQLSEMRSRLIGFIFQGYNLIKDLTAYENVELPLVYRGVSIPERRRLSLDALKRVDLLDRMNHKPNEMSGGQQQRVAIARAIASAPPVVMADEPTGNLDSRSSEVVMEQLVALNQSGTTVILITHDEVVARLARRVIRIHDGMIVEDYLSGSVREEAVLA